MLWCHHSPRHTSPQSESMPDHLASHLTQGRSSPASVCRQRGAPIAISSTAPSSRAPQAPSGVPDVTALPARLFFRDHAFRPFSRELLSFTSTSPPLTDRGNRVQHNFAGSQFNSLCFETTALNQISYSFQRPSTPNPAV